MWFFVAVARAVCPLQCMHMFSNLLRALTIKVHVYVPLTIKVHVYVPLTIKVHVYVPLTIKVHVYVHSPSKYTFTCTHHQSIRLRALTIKLHVYVPLTIKVHVYVPLTIKVHADNISERSHRRHSLSGWSLCTQRGIRSWCGPIHGTRTQPPTWVRSPPSVNRRLHSPTHNQRSRVQSPPKW
jgi:hypothetical protein